MAEVVKKYIEKTFGEGAYHVILSVLLSIAVSLQVLIVLAAVFSFIPIKLDSSLDHVLPQVLALFRPEREMFFYQFFVVLTIAVQIACIAVFKDRWHDEDFFRKLGQFLIAEYCWIALEIFAVFKILIYKGLFWSNALFYTALALSLASKVFWPEVRMWSGRVYAAAAGLSKDRRCVRTFDAFFMGFLVLALWVPDKSSALGVILAHDQFFGLDSFLVSPAHARVMGETPNVDVLAPLGTGAPTLITWSARILGGLNYEHVLGVMVILGLLYFFAVYVLLRMWFKSCLIAAAGTLVAVKLQLFNISVVPLIWAFPQYTPLRLLPDLITIFFIWRYSRDFKRLDLWLAAGACGLSMAYVFDTGIYQTSAFYGFLAAVLFLPNMRLHSFTFPRDARKIFAICLLPWGAMVVFSFILSGPAVFTKAWWAGNMEFMNGYWQGAGNIPMTSALYARQFFAFAMGLAVPVIFLVSAAGLLFKGYFNETRRKDLWIVFVCFYGLAAHAYFVHRSVPALYNLYSVALVILGCYGSRLLADGLTRQRRRVFLLVAAVVSFGALVTNNQFVSYPNALDLNRHGWKAEREAYRSASALEKDVELIKGLTKPGEKTAVISSFAAKMLMDAGRSTYFYYSPVIVSAPMDANVFRGTTLFSRDRMFKTLTQLEEDPPAYVFVEKKIYDLQITKEYEPSLQSWIVLKVYLDEHYAPGAEGQYLVALKRNP